MERWPDIMAAVKHPNKVERWPDRIVAVRHSGGISAEKNSGCEMSGWNVGGATCRKGKGATRQFLGRIPR